MSDITTCEGSGCPAKALCWRHISMFLKRYQSRFNMVPFDHDRSLCLDFLPLEDGLWDQYLAEMKVKGVIPDDDMPKNCEHGGVKLDDGDGSKQH